MSELQAKDDLVKKRTLAWGKFGGNLTSKEDALGAGSLDIESGLENNPPTLDNIPAAEATLKVAKKALQELKAVRLEVTNPLDKVKERLISHEKGTAEKIKAYENAIISKKREKQNLQAAANGKKEEERDLIAKIKSSYIDYFLHVKNTVSNKVNEVYLGMLEAGVKYEDFDSHVHEVKLEKIKHAPFFQRQNYAPKYLSDAEWKEIYKANMQKPADVIALFAEGIMNKKAGYRSELANKAKAKELLEAQKKKDGEAAKAKAEQEKLALKIDNAAAVDAVPKDKTTKALKEKFEVDMPNDHASALALYACFSANINEILQHLKVKNWLDLKPSQIAKVLGKIKSADNNFEFEGITFKSIDALK